MSGLRISHAVNFKTIPPPFKGFELYLVGEKRRKGNIFAFLESLFPGMICC
jgi:hypothetical protein